MCRLLSVSSPGPLGGAYGAALATFASNFVGTPNDVDAGATYEDGVYFASDDDRLAFAAEAEQVITAFRDLRDERARVFERAAEAVVELTPR